MIMRAVLLSIASGAIFGAAWRDSIPAFCGVLGLSLFFVVQNQHAGARWLSRVSMAWLTGFTAFAIACGWVTDTAEYLLDTDSKFVVVPVALAVWSIHAFPFMLFAALLPTCQLWGNRLLVMPPLWLLGETLCPSLFPFPAGCLLLDFAWLAQPAEIGGISLLSLLAATYALLLPYAIELRVWVRECKQRQKRKGKVTRNATRKERNKARRKAIVEKEDSWELGRVLGQRWRVASLVGGLALLNGWAAYRSLGFESPLGEKAESLDILLVQVDTAHEKANSRMQGATRKVAGKADLVLWPECSIGNFEQSLESFADSSLVLAASKEEELAVNPVGAPETPMLVGGDSWVRGDKGEALNEYVSAYLIDRGGTVLGRHDKVSLMPYGESIPGESFFPVLRNWFGSKRVLSRGESISLIGSVSGTQIGTVLCCEDMYPEICRQLTEQGAEILVSLANGIAFKSNVALQQHFRISRCRAIENGRYLVRCASRGVSGVIAPNGKLQKSLPILEDCGMMVRVPRQTCKTVYSQFGSIPLIFVCVAYCILAIKELWPATALRDLDLPKKALAAKPVG